MMEKLIVAPWYRIVHQMQIFGLGLEQHHEKLRKCVFLIEFSI